MKKFYFFLSVAIVLLIELVMALRSDEYQKIGTYYFGENTDNKTPAYVDSANGNVVVVGKKEMLTFNEIGEVKWKKPLFSAGAFLAMSEEDFAVCDRNTGELYILSYDGEMIYHSGKHGKVYKIKSFNGSYGIQTAEGIYIYSKSNQKVYFIELNVGDLIDFGYSDTHKKIAVISLDSDVNCYINLLSVTGEITAGKIMLEGLVFGVSLDADSIRVLKDDGVLVFDYFLEEQEGYWLSESDSALEDVEAFSLKNSGSGTGIVDQNSVVYSYNFDDNLLCGKHEGYLALWCGDEKLFDLEKPVKKAIAIDDGYLLKLLDQDTSYMVDESGVIKPKTVFEDAPLDIVKISDKAFVLVYSNRLDFFRR